MNLSHAYGTMPREDEAVRLLNHALDIGVSFLDTAAIYGEGANERLLGKAVMHRRSEFMLASKCALDIVDGKRVIDARPETILATLDRALDRLRTDHIDLYYLHRPDRSVPIEDSVGALARARAAGKIRAIGLSEMSAEELRRAHATHPIAAVQSEYSPCVRNPEIAVLDTCRELGIGFVAFSPVARGLLADSVHDDRYEPHDIRRTMPRFNEPFLSPNLRIVARFNALAQELGRTPAQLAIGWVLAQGQNIVVLPGTRNIAHLDEDVSAATLGLSADMIERIDTIFASNPIRGARYSKSAQAGVSTEIFPDEDLA